MNRASFEPGPFRHARARPVTDGWSVFLDDRRLRLPGDAPFGPVSRRLAEAVASEWDASPRSSSDARRDHLPMFRLAATCQMRVAPDRAGTCEALLGFADADALRHRAVGPAPLRDRENEAWQPWLDWVAARWNAVVPAVEGVMPVTLPPSTRDAFGTALRSLDDAALTVLIAIVPALGSLVLGLAVVCGEIGVEAAVGVSVVDAAFNAERWGAHEALDRERSAAVAILSDACRFLDLVRSP